MHVCRRIIEALELEPNLYRIGMSKVSASEW